MNFSVIVERVVAPKLVRDELSKRNSATFIQFFARFPQLYPFLLNKLTEQLQHFADSKVTDSPLPSCIIILPRITRRHTKEKKRSR